MKSILRIGIGLIVFSAVAGCGINQPTNSTTATKNTVSNTVSAKIHQKYGGIRNEFRLGDGWILTTLGNQSSRGVIGLYNCSPKDTACLSGQKLLPLAGWKFYKPPFAGGITLLATKGNTIIIDNGGHQLSFNMSTHRFTTRNG